MTALIQETTPMVSACGIFDCGGCSHQIRKKCIGCSQGNALMQAHGDVPCAIFQCTRSHNIATCSDCTEALCSFTRSVEMVCPVRANFEKKRCYARKMSDHFSARQPSQVAGTLVSKKLDKAIARLPWYLFAVQDFISHGVLRISSDDIARKVNVKSWLVRRDLSQFGEFGRPSVGYDANRLRECLSEILHLDSAKNVVWVGAARIEADKTLIKRFSEHNYRIVAIFDSDLSHVPEMIGGVKVMSITEMPQVVADLGAQGAIIATSGDEAQEVADALAAAGIMGMLNLTSTLIATPPNVCVRNVDIVAELFALSYYCGELHGNGANAEVQDQDVDSA
jgi:redox-sensing transcriptional repressor